MAFFAPRSIVVAVPADVAPAVALWVVARGKGTGLREKPPIPYSNDIY
eukprot:COSAG06_NODE_4622_length_4092_cov_2.411971_4_plen_48_part_00